MTPLLSTTAIVPRVEVGREVGECRLMSHNNQQTDATGAEKSTDHLQIIDASFIILLHHWMAMKDSDSTVRSPLIT
jgi:hypothetical protein